MNKNGMGVGSALIVLVFAVLCLAIFTVITYTQAQNDMALTLAEKELVTGYYAADTQAEQMAAHLVFTGVEGSEGITSFTCPINDTTELYVEIVVHEHDFDVLSWHMRDTGAWNADESLNVWQGVETEDSINVMTDGGASLWGGQ